MAEYRLREDAESWFKHIANQAPLRTKFDLYYFCLMLGLATGRRSNPSENVKAQGFYDSMPEPYKNIQELITGVLLRTEIARFGIKLTDRTGVRRILTELVGSSGLSSVGIVRLNEYASGGFDVIFEHMLEAPYTVSGFFGEYKKLMDLVMDK